MRITADTNVLVRAALGDDPDQAPLAEEALREAEMIAVPVPVLCEFVWVLARGYQRERADIAESIRRLIDSATVEVDRPVVEAGLRFLEEGGDFADGVIVFEGRRLGGEVFVSFDEGAVRLAREAGARTRLLPRG
jgi:predicted nucleic-acid-binding protein